MADVILVDHEDTPIGVMEKMEAHRTGTLHRAYSILLFNSKGELLLQQRSNLKYHSGGLWTNTCCSHPSPGEDTSESVSRKLFQELGIQAQPSFAYKFLYKAHLDHQLIEHEVDHVFIGKFDGTPLMNPEEVQDWKYESLDKIRQEVSLNPSAYTAWFREILKNPLASPIA